VHNKKIYSTFVGVGLDFNTELVQQVTTNIRGSSYSSVKSARHFKKHMNEDFDYAFAGLTFNMELHVESGKYQIDAVYGSPEADESTGSLMKIGTLFPSSRKNGETKGGVVVLKLKKKNNDVVDGDGDDDDDDVKLVVKYEDEDGNKYQQEEKIKLKKWNDEVYFENLGVRKAILLTHYVNFLKNYLQGVTLNEQSGILAPKKTTSGVTHSARLDDNAKKIWNHFVDYVQKEMEIIGDDNLRKDLSVLENILKESNN